MKAITVTRSTGKSLEKTRNSTQKSVRGVKMTATGKVVAVVVPVAEAEATSAIGAIEGGIAVEAEVEVGASVTTVVETGITMKDGAKIEAIDTERSIHGGKIIMTTEYETIGGMNEGEVMKPVTVAIGELVAKSTTTSDTINQTTTGSTKATPPTTAMGAQIIDMAAKEAQAMNQKA